MMTTTAKLFAFTTAPHKFIAVYVCMHISTYTDTQHNRNIQCSVYISCEPNNMNFSFGQTSAQHNQNTHNRKDAQHSRSICLAEPPRRQRQLACILSGKSRTQPSTATAFYVPCPITHTFSRAHRTELNAHFAAERRRRWTDHHATTTTVDGVFISFSLIPGIIPTHTHTAQPAARTYTFFAGATMRRRRRRRRR